MAFTRLEEFNPEEWILSTPNEIKTIWDEICKYLQKTTTLLLRRRFMTLRNCDYKARHIKTTRNFIKDSISYINSSANFLHSRMRALDRIICLNINQRILNDTTDN